MGPEAHGQNLVAGIQQIGAVPAAWNAVVDVQLFDNVVTRGATVAQILPNLARVVRFLRNTVAHLGPVRAGVAGDLHLAVGGRARAKAAPGVKPRPLAHPASRAVRLAAARSWLTAPFVLGVWTP